MIAETFDTLWFNKIKKLRKILRNYYIYLEKKEDFKMTGGDTLKPNSNKNNGTVSNEPEFPEAAEGNLWGWIIVGASFCIHMIGKSF